MFTINDLIMAFLAGANAIIAIDYWLFFKRPASAVLPLVAVALFGVAIFV